MGTKQIAPGVHQLSAGGVNVTLVDRGGLIVIDAGLPNKLDQILGAVGAIGHTANDVTDILITHYHQDHIGSLEELARATGANVHAPAGDADLIRDGGKAPAPGHRGVLGIMLSTLIKMKELPAAPVHHEIADGNELTVGGGVKVIGTPGHTPGHVSFLLDGGILIAGDAAGNMLGRLGVFPIGEDFTSAEASFRKMSELDFGVAGFGHGRTITSGAAARFRAVVEKYR